VHHRARILLRVMVRGEGHGAHRRPRHAVHLEQTRAAHREHLGRRDEPVGHAEGGLSAHVRALARFPKAPELTLSERAEDHYAIG
jgi:hypothetical protein